MNFNIEGVSSSLFSEKILASWSICDKFMICWSKSKGFGVIKDKVVKEGDTIRRRLYICEHGKKYTSKSNKNTSTKKILCQWHINASYPKENNSDSAIFINIIVNEHNHDLNIEAVAFKEDKRFSDKMMNDIQFLTQHCKLGATTQRKY